MRVSWPATSLTWVLLFRLNLPIVAVAVPPCRHHGTWFPLSSAFSLSAMCYWSTCLTRHELPAGLEGILPKSTQQLLRQSGKTCDTFRVGVCGHLIQNMISHFNLTGIPGDFGFSSLDREEIETFFCSYSKTQWGQCWNSQQKESAHSLCGGHEGSSAAGQHPAVGNVHWTLRLSSAGCLKLEEGQKIISLSRNANKPSRFNHRDSVGILNRGKG